MQNTSSTRAPRFKRYDQSEGCAVERALEVIGGKWKGVILFHLLDGTMRFGEIRQAIGKVTQRTLTRQLRELEADGIITRTVHPVQPPHVDYALTDKGAALAPMLYALQKWGRSQLALGPQRD
ncbi:winged helix-turn-helix transcriptional regulator [Paracoccus jiaweipingae]|uniref:winged helix-turn-helix transcriptional regulator n=1 Tax=unclassified Paracoccus (in: a-proteobacteria) TaxID=2688777 RepID=UPI0037885284